MQLIRWGLSTSWFLMLAACGPESVSDWGIGVYSNHTEGQRDQIARVTHYDIREDGTAVISSVNIDNVEEVGSKRRWVRRDEYTIDLLFEDAGKI